MKKLIFLSCCFLLLIGCRKDSEQEIIDEQIYEPPVITVPGFKPVTASVFGLVVDKEGNPVADAKISMGTEEKRTSNDGHFVFSNKLMNQAGTFIKVEKEGYHLGAARFFPAILSKNYVHIRMLKQIESGRFQAEQGGFINESNGLQIDFPPNSIIDANNNSYNGEVIVFSRWIDPEGDHLEKAMSGNLQGIDSKNKEVVLANYGMVAVELKSPNGESLNLGNGQKAKVTFPLSNAAASNAPADIPLWSFHEEAGIWIEEAVASLQGNTFVGTVNHFSFWLLSLPFPLIELSGTFVSQDGLPLSNVVVGFKFSQSSNIANLSYNVRTDNNGFFSGKATADEAFSLSVSPSHHLSCNSVPMSVPPSSTDTDLGIITIDEPYPIDMTGLSIDCFGGQPEQLKVLLTYDNEERSYYFENQSQVELSFIGCDEWTEVQVQVFDLINFRQSLPIVVPILNNQTNWGPLPICTPSDQFVKLNLDGVETNIINDIDARFNELRKTFFARQWPIGEASISVLFNELNSPGNYDGSIINFIDLSNVASANGSISIACYMDCNIDQVIISEFGAVDEKIIGSIEGTLTVMQEDLPFTIDFQVTRDE